MPRFVVLEHDGPRGLHWDFMLERGETLATWALPSPPDAASAAATALPDHRPAYLDYEGPILGDRGSVRRWDAGFYECVVWSALRIAVDVAGTRLAGRVTLSCEGDSAGPWTLTYQPREPRRTSQ